MFNEAVNENEDKLNNEEEITFQAKESKLQEDKKSKKMIKKIKKNENLLLKYTIIFFSVLFLLCTFFLILHIYNNQPYLIIDNKNILKPLDHENQYRIIRLRNGISVILISSNDKNSHFSLTIPIGYLNEKKEYGLAHLVEHMFFHFNTLTYFLRKWSSYIISYTKEYKTSFYFEIDNANFAKSLFNLKKIIQEPKFKNISRLQEELNKINDEFIIKKDDDIIRQYQILKSLSKENNLKDGNLANKNILMNKWDYRNQKKPILLKYFQYFFKENGEFNENLKKIGDFYKKNKGNRYEKIYNDAYAYTNMIKNPLKISFLEFDKKKKSSFMKIKIAIRKNKNSILNDAEIDNDIEDKDLEFTGKKEENKKTKDSPNEIETDFSEAFEEDKFVKAKIEKKNSNSFTKEENKNNLNRTKKNSIKAIKILKTKEDALKIIKELEKKFDDDVGDLEIENKKLNETKIIYQEISVNKNFSNENIHPNKTKSFSSNIIRNNFPLKSKSNSNKNIHLNGVKQNTLLNKNSKFNKQFYNLNFTHLNSVIRNHTNNLLKNSLKNIDVKKDNFMLNKKTKNFIGKNNSLISFSGKFDNGNLKFKKNISEKNVIKAINNITKSLNKSQKINKKLNKTLNYTKNIDSFSNYTDEDNKFAKKILKEILSSEGKKIVKMKINFNKSDNTSIKNINLVNTNSSLVFHKKIPNITNDLNQNNLLSNKTNFSQNNIHTSELIKFYGNDKIPLVENSEKISTEINKADKDIYYINETNNYQIYNNNTIFNFYLNGAENLENILDTKNDYDKENDKSNIETDAVKESNKFPNFNTSINNSLNNEEYNYPLVNNLLNENELKNNLPNSSNEKKDKISIKSKEIFPVDNNKNLNKIDKIELKEIKYLININDTNKIPEKTLITFKNSSNLNTKKSQKSKSKKQKKNKTHNKTKELEKFNFAKQINSTVINKSNEIKKNKLDIIKHNFIKKEKEKVLQIKNSYKKEKEKKYASIIKTQNLNKLNNTKNSIENKTNIENTNLDKNSRLVLKNLSNRIEDFFNENYKVKDIVIIAKSQMQLDDLSSLLNEAFSDLTWGKSNEISYSNYIKSSMNKEDNNTEEEKETFSERKNRIKEIKNFRKNKTNNQKAKRKNKKTFDDKLSFAKNDLGKLIFYKRKNQEKTLLDYFFPIPIENFDDYDKPYEFLNYLLKYENKNGLINKLKSAGVITNLNADKTNISKEFFFYKISIEFETDDERFIPVVNNYLFQYINLIKNCIEKDQKNFEEVLSDLQKIMEIDFELFDYHDDPKKMESIFQRIYDNFNKYKKSDLLFGDFNSSETNIKSFKEFLNFIKSENAIVMYGTQGEFNSLKYIRHLYKDEVIFYETENYFNSEFISGYMENSFISISNIFNNFTKNFYNENFEDTNKTNKYLDGLSYINDNIEKNLLEKFKYNSIEYFSREKHLVDKSFKKKFEIFNIFNKENLRKKNNFVTNLLNFNRYEDFGNKNVTGNNNNSNKDFLKNENYEVSNKEKELSKKIVNQKYGNWRNNPYLLINQKNFKLYYTELKNIKLNQISIFMEFIFIQSKKNITNSHYLNILFLFTEDYFKSKLLELEITRNNYTLELTENGILLKLLVFEDILPSIANLIANIFTPKSNFVINFFDFWKFKEEEKILISEKIDSEKISAKLEKEIFNKIIKFNYTNIFDLIQSSPKIIFDDFEKNMKIFFESISIKCSVTGLFYKEKNLDEFVNIFSKYLSNVSSTDNKEVFQLIAMNKILDDSYIFRKKISNKFLKESAMLNIYQYGEFDSKTFITFKLLEVIMNIQFTSNEMLNLDFKNLKEFSHGLKISDGRIISYKFFAVTDNVKECNVILNQSLVKFKNELFIFMTNANLGEYKTILLNLLKEKNNKCRTINERSNYIWKNLELNEVDYSKYLSDIYLQDIMKLYDKIFFESKILSIQAISTLEENNLHMQNKEKIHIYEEEINIENNIVMKVIENDYEYFGKIGDYLKYQGNYTLNDNDNDYIPSSAIVNSEDEGNTNTDQ